MFQFVPNYIIYALRTTHSAICGIKSLSVCFLFFVLLFRVCLLVCVKTGGLCFLSNRRDAWFSLVSGDIQCTDVDGGSREVVLLVLPAALASFGVRFVDARLGTFSGSAGGSCGKFCIGASATLSGILLVPTSNEVLRGPPGTAEKPSEFDRCSCGAVLPTESRRFGGSS